MPFSYVFYIFAVIIALAIAYLVVPLVEKLAFRLGAVDQPNARKVHEEPMPRMGGLSIYLGFVVVILASLLATSGLSRSIMGILIGATIVFIVGAIDDVYRLSAWTKLFAEIVAALIVVLLGVQMQVLTNPFDGVIRLGQMGIPLTMFWIIGVTNAVNLIDGLDGLAAGVSGIAAITIGVVALRSDQYLVGFMALVLAGAVAGFLPRNFFPARIFMGDSGALFLGFVLACLSVTGLAKSAALISLFVPVIILGIPIFDTFFAIVRRVNNGMPIFKPDKAHLHHRLMDMGNSHRRTVIIIYIISILLGAVGVLLMYLTSPQAMLILAILTVAMVIGAGRIGIIGRIDEEEEMTVSNESEGVSKGV